MWCLEIDTLSHGLASITQETGSAQCLVPSGRTSTIMVNLPVGFQMESWLSDGVHTNPSILANRNILVPAKYLAPRDGFIAFTLVQGTNSRLDFFKRCDAFHWAAPLPAFPRFPEASFSCLFLFTFLRSTLFGTCFGLLAAFLGKKMWWSPAQDVLTELFRGNFPCWRSLYVAPRLGASPAVQSNLDFLQSVDPWP